MNSFAVFILSNRRPDNVITIKTLRKSGYTGRILVVLDDEDPTIDEYKKHNTDCDFYVFNKRLAMSLTDSADNTGNPKAVVYARNMTHQIARASGVDYFLVLDDDYSDFLSTTKKGKFKRTQLKNADDIFSTFVEFLKTTPTQTICFAQGGDFIGVSRSRFAKIRMLSRKAMNSFFCATDRPFQFYGLTNEDVNMYVLDGSRGRLNFTSTEVQLNQAQTQANDGGLTAIYLEQGTYIKSFYTVMYHPSSVKVSSMGRYSKRIHHEVKSDLTYPKILREELKK